MKINIPGCCQKKKGLFERMLHWCFYWYKLMPSHKVSKNGMFFVEKATTNRSNKIKLYTEMHQSPVDLQIPKALKKTTTSNLVFIVGR